MPPTRLVAGCHVAPRVATAARCARARPQKAAPRANTSKRHGYYRVETTISVTAETLGSPQQLASAGSDVVLREGATQGARAVLGGRQVPELPAARGGAMR